MLHNVLLPLVNPTFLQDLSLAVLDSNVHCNESILSHLSDIWRIVDINHLKALIVMSLSGVEMVTLDVVETVGAVCSGHGHHLGEVGEINSVLALLASRNDGQEVVAPHDLLGNKGGPDLAGGAGGLRGAVEEDDQLKVLFVERVHRHLKEGAVLVDDVVESERTYEEEVVFPSIYHKVNVHLVHDDCLPVWCVGCPQQLTIDLASDHQGLA